MGFLVTKSWRISSAKYLIGKKFIFVYYHRYSEKIRQAADVEKQQIRLISYLLSR